MWSGGLCVCGGVCTPGYPLSTKTSVAVPDPMRAMSRFERLESAASVAFAAKGELREYSSKRDESSHRIAFTLLQANHRDSDCF